MSNALTRGFVGSGILVCFAIVLALAIQGYKLVVPEQVEHNSANFTQADFDQAKARWDSQKIQVYEFTVEDTRAHKLQARLRVDKTTNNLYLMALTVDGLQQTVDGLASPLTSVTEEVYRVYTVDSLFESIGSELQSVSAGSPQAANSGLTRFTDLEVSFDPVRGNPVNYTEYLRKTLTSNEITWRSTQESIQVSDFTVLR